MGCNEYFSSSYTSWYSDNKYWVWVPCKMIGNQYLEIFKSDNIIASEACRWFGDREVHNLLWTSVLSWKVPLASTQHSPGRNVCPASSPLEFNFIPLGFPLSIKNRVITRVLSRAFWTILLMKVKPGCTGKTKLVWVIILLRDCRTIWGILEGEVPNSIECVRCYAIKK